MSALTLEIKFERKKIYLKKYNNFPAKISEEAVGVFLNALHIYTITYLQSQKRSMNDVTDRTDWLWHHPKSSTMTPTLPYMIYSIFFSVAFNFSLKKKKEIENKFSHLRCTHHQLCSTKGQKQENQLRPAAAGLICCRRFTTSTNGSFEAGRKDSSGGNVGRGFNLQSSLAKLCNIVQGGGGGGERGGGEEGAGRYKSSEGPESSESSSGASGGPRSRNPNQVKVNGSSAPDLF